MQTWLILWYNTEWWFLWVRLFKTIHIPLVIDEWEFIEKRLIVVSIELFWYELFIDYILDHERVIETE